MAIEVTLLGDLFDGETQEQPDDFGLYGAFIPHDGRTYVYRFKEDLTREDGSIHRYLEFSERLDFCIPEFLP